MNTGCHSVLSSRRIVSSNRMMDVFGRLSVHISLSYAAAFFALLIVLCRSTSLFQKKWTQPMAPKIEASMLKSCNSFQHILTEAHRKVYYWHSVPRRPLQITDSRPSIFLEMSLVFCPNSTTGLSCHYRAPVWPGFSINPRMLSTVTGSNTTPS